MPKYRSILGKVADAFRGKQPDPIIIKLDQQVALLSEDYKGGNIQEALESGFINIVSTEVVGEVSSKSLEKLQKGVVNDILIRNSVEISKKIHTPVAHIDHTKDKKLVPGREPIKKHVSPEYRREDGPVKERRSLPAEAPFKEDESAKFEKPKSKYADPSVIPSSSPEVLPEEPVSAQPSSFELSDEVIEKLADMIGKKIHIPSPTTTYVNSPVAPAPKTSQSSIDRPPGVRPVLEDLPEVDSDINTTATVRSGSKTKSALDKLKQAKKK